MAQRQQKQQQAPAIVASISLLPFFLLKLIRHKQQKHGLRHENYQRYRIYCSRRIERIRKTLKCTHTYKCVPNRPGRFVPKPIQPEQLSDSRYLEICVFEIERNWAYYKQLKLEYEQKRSRKIFHARHKLRRAVKCSRNLAKLIEQNEQLDEITRSEVAAYIAFMEALLHFEFSRFTEATGLLDSSKATYKSLMLNKQQKTGKVKSNEGEVSDMNSIDEFYVSRCREIDFLLGACRDDSSAALLGGLNTLNLNLLSAADNVDDDNKPPPNKKTAVLKTKEQKCPRPLKPFFFDLALNFVDTPEAFKNN